MENDYWYISGASPKRDAGLAASYQQWQNAVNPSSAPTWKNSVSAFDKGLDLPTTNTNLNTSDTGLFGLKNTTWGNIGTAGQLGLGLANTLTAMRQLELQKDAFRFNKDMKNKEYAMAKDAYDRNVARAASIGEQMRKGQVS